MAVGFRNSSASVFLSSHAPPRGSWNGAYEGNTVSMPRPRSQAASASKAQRRGKQIFKGGLTWGINLGFTPLGAVST